MSNNPIASVLNATLASIHEFASIQTGAPKLVAAPIVQTDYGVLVGIVGDVKGRLFILGEAQVFSKAGLAMYGMELSGEMLESFVGEFGNSVAGHTATKLYNEGITVDITPPTTLQGQVRLGGFSEAIAVPFQMEGDIGGQLVLALENNTQK